MIVKTIDEPFETFFPPPWSMGENFEKTEGWIEFQKAMRKDPEYYLCSVYGHNWLRFPMTEKPHCQVCGILLDTDITLNIPNPFGKNDSTTIPLST